MSTEEQQIFVRRRYPDAYARKYAALSMVIWCPMLDCRLSGFFHTEKEAWEDALVWVVKKKKVPELKSYDDLKNFVIMKDGSLMDVEEWMAIPHRGTRHTEDADFEVIEPKQIENKNH